jgi:hypothetical protein
MRKILGAFVFAVAAAVSIAVFGALGNQLYMGGPGGAAWRTVSGDTTITNAGVTTTAKVNGVSYGTSPGTNTVAVVTGTNATTYEAVPNAALANSTMTVNGTTCTLGSSCAPVSAAPLSSGSSTGNTFTAPEGYFVCTAACTVTPPVPAAGYEFCVLNADNATGVITLGAIGSSARYENTARTAYGTAGTGTLSSAGAVGDMACIVGLDSTHYLTTTFVGTWTAS